MSLAGKDAEIARLRAAVAEHRRDKEIMGKAAVYFANDAGW